MLRFRASLLPNTAGTRKERGLGGVNAAKKQLLSKIAFVCSDLRYCGYFLCHIFSVPADVVVWTSGLSQSRSHHHSATN